MDMGPNKFLCKFYKAELLTNNFKYKNILCFL